VYKFWTVLLTVLIAPYVKFLFPSVPKVYLMSIESKHGNSSCAVVYGAGLFGHTHVLKQEYVTGQDSILFSVQQGFLNGHGSLFSIDPHTDPENHFCNVQEYLAEGPHGPSLDKAGPDHAIVAIKMPAPCQ
jgi:hypothetical protein